MNVCGAAVPITSQGILIDDFHAACTTKLDHTTMLEVRQRTADCLDRQREVIGNVVARDWEDHQFGRAVGHSLCHFKKERADLFECSDPPHDDKLGLQSRDGLERRLAKFSCEPRVCVRQEFHALARVASHNRAFNDYIDRIVVFPSGSEPEEVTREQEIYDLTVAVGARHVSYRRAGLDAVQK